MEVNVVIRYGDINHSDYDKVGVICFPFLNNIYNENYYDEVSFVIKNLLEQVNWNSLASDKTHKSDKLMLKQSIGLR